MDEGSAESGAIDDATTIENESRGFCPECGAAATSKFCPKCGTDLREQPVQPRVGAPTSESSTSAPPVAAAADDEPSAGADGGTRRWRRAAVITVVALGCLLLGGAAYALLSPLFKEDPAAEAPALPAPPPKLKVPTVKTISAASVLHGRTAKKNTHAAPGAPTGVIIAPSNRANGQEVLVQWNEPVNAKQANVVEYHAFTQNGGECVTSANGVEPGPRSCYIGGLDPSMAYAALVFAVNSDGAYQASKWSSWWAFPSSGSVVAAGADQRSGVDPEASASADDGSDLASTPGASAAAPLAPTELAAVGDEDGAITVTWTPGDQVGTSFTVTSTDATVPAATLSSAECSSTCSTTFSGLTPGMAYTFSAKAAAGSLTSPSSAEVSALAGQPVTGVTATGPVTGVVTVNWTAAPDAVGYTSTLSLQRRDVTADGEWSDVETGLAATSTTTSDSPTPGSTYRYRIVRTVTDSSGVVVMRAFSLPSEDVVAGSVSASPTAEATASTSPDTYGTPTPDDYATGSSAPETPTPEISASDANTLAPADPYATSSGS